MKQSVRNHVTEILEKHRDPKRPEEIKHLGYTFRVSKGVFSPFIAPSGALSLAFSGLPLFANNTFLDIGCGCGILPTLAAKSGARRVVGIDINPAAIDDCDENAKRLGVEKTTKFLHGNLFEPLSRSEKFDIIFADLPFARGNPKDDLERAFYDEDLSAVQQFIADFHNVLTKSGRAYLCFSDIDQLDVHALVRKASQTCPGADLFMRLHKPWVRLSLFELRPG